jgi:hypothetical protein
LTRSNGHSAARGKLTPDYRDFLANIGPRELYFASPLPGFPGTTNAGVHEYNLVREQSESPKFERLNLGIYFHLIECDLRDVEDPQTVRDLRRLVDEHRQRTDRSDLQRDIRAARLGKLREKTSIGYLGRKLAKSLSRSAGDYQKGRWQVLRGLGIEPFAVREHVTRWPNTAAALEYAQQHLLPRIDARSPLEYRVSGHLVEIADG